MATFTEKVLAEGELPSTKGTLFTATERTVVTFFSVLNENVTLETGKIYYKRATSRPIYPFKLKEDQAVQVVGKHRSVILEVGDLLEGVSTTATGVHYVIMGIEKT